MYSFDSRTIAATPWVNGAGTRQELAASALEGIPWRFSSAQIDRDCPFSTYPGLARQHVIVDGLGTCLTGAGIDLDVIPLSPVAFDGDTALECRLKDGPCTAMNVVYDPAHIRAELSVLYAGAHDVVARELVVFCLFGAASVNGAGITMGQGAVVEGRATVTVNPAACVLCAMMDPI
ncbi:HutD family protein [Roseovarius aestuarii]|nr:HutD family protein [Roseovarius aestuarii]